MSVSVRPSPVVQFNAGSQQMARLDGILSRMFVVVEQQNDPDVFFNRILSEQILDDISEAPSYPVDGFNQLVDETNLWHTRACRSLKSRKRYLASLRSCNEALEGMDLNRVRTVRERIHQSFDNLGINGKATLSALNIHAQEVSEGTLAYAELPLLLLDVLLLTINVLALKKAQQMPDLRYALSEYIDQAPEVEVHERLIIQSLVLNAFDRDECVLEISGYHKITCLPEVLHYLNLRLFHVSDCDAIQCLPESLVGDPALAVDGGSDVRVAAGDNHRLQELSISKCKSFKHLSAGMDRLVGLKVLYLKDLLSLKIVPQVHLPKLDTLFIASCGMDVLPEEWVAGPELLALYLTDLPIKSLPLSLCSALKLKIMGLSCLYDLRAFQDDFEQLFRRLGLLRIVHCDSLEVARELYDKLDDKPAIQEALKPYLPSYLNSIFQRCIVQ